ncbi:MAG: chemotaxis protein CheW [Burkholderiales bacterium]|nr:chemotaxis protein CheW [Burkholderiales bacterium]
MANREALRELQSRLARRLQQARTEQRGTSWLAVECAGLGLLVPLPTAGEIFPVGTLLPVPHTQPWFLGVTNLRGGMHGVVDLAAFLGLRAPTAPDAMREGAQLLAFNAVQGAHCAILIDRLSGLRSAAQLAALPDEGPARPAFAAARWRDDAGRVWQEIDLAALAHNEQFLAIAA